MDEGNQRSHFWAVTMCHGIGSLAVFSINGCYARTCYIRIMPVFVCHSDDIPFSVLQNSYRRCRSKTFGWFMHLLKRHFWNSALLHEGKQDGRECMHASLAFVHLIDRSREGVSEGSDSRHIAKPLATLLCYDLIGPELNPAGRTARCQDVRLSIRSSQVNVGGTFPLLGNF